jgi:DNA repair protein RadD
MNWSRKCLDPALIEAPTGSGKSHIVAEIAHQLRDISGKSVLVLAPKAELVHQNREKFLNRTGEPASMYSASAGSKCLKHDVVFGTPGTVKRATDKIGPRLVAVIVDEAHGLTPTVRGIIDDLREHNPRLRVIGLTATPYRLDTGYIYASTPDGEAIEQSNEPYFARLVERIPAEELIEQGYLTPPAIGGTNDAYDSSRLERSRTGSFTTASLEQAYEGQGRKTSKIVADIVEQARDRMGVMIFAATRQHAREVMDSLPPGMSELVTGETNSKERKRILADFKSQRAKYLVNVDVLTTGFDAEHVDTIALLRHTESPGLMQQIIGRGLRAYPNKSECLVLDYADNIATHTPDGDLFNPQITAPVRVGYSGDPIKAECERCGFVNEFPSRENPDGYEIDSYGYFVDLDGERVQGDYGPMPAHYGRRCLGTLVANGHMDRCAYRWTYRECDECGAGNDIAARYCESCRAELVDPNEKLRLDFERHKADPYEVQTDEVLAWQVRDTLSKSGNPMYRVDYTTPYRTVTAFYLYTHSAKKAQRKWERFRLATDNATQAPTTITYYKDRASGFWEVINYNENPDVAPDVG